MLPSLMVHIHILCFGERGNKMSDSRSHPKETHSTKILALWEPNYVDVEK